MSDSWNAIFQNCWYVGDNFNCILYGVELVLYFTTVWLLLDARARRKRHCVVDSTEPAKSWRILFLSTGILCMITIYLFAQNFFGQQMWINNAGYPGGSGQYYSDHAAVWYQTMGSASSVVMNYMSDAYFIHRVYTIWDCNVYVIIIPSILYAGTFVLGILTCYYSGRPGGDFFVGIAPRIALAYSAVGIAMNIICTLLICARIFYITQSSGSREVGVLHSDSRRNQMFYKVIEMIVESMLPYTLFGVAYVTTLGLNSPVSILFLSLYIMFTCLSPQILILRVILRRKRRDEHTLTDGQNSSMRFGGFTKSRADTGTFALSDLPSRGDASGSLSDTHASNHV